MAASLYLGPTTCRMDCMHKILYHNNWRAPCKPARYDYFVAIFQVAQNPLKFGMPTPLLWKKRPCVVFPQAGKQDFKTRSWKSTPRPSHNAPLPPPPPPPTHTHTPPSPPSNSVKDTVFCLSRIEILHCLEMDREGGVEFHAILSIFFCILDQKHGDIF